MKRYKKYKPSGVEWIGKIPEHWNEIKLKWAVNINPSKSNCAYDPNSHELVTFLPMERVYEDARFDNSLKKPIKELWNGFTYFEEGDIIFAKITPCFENGKGALLKDLGSPVGFGSTEFHVLRAKEDINREFVYYITRTRLFRNMGEALMYGAAGQKRVPTSFLEGFIIVLPPVEEQTTITNYLDRKTIQIDDLIAKKQKLIDLLNEEKTAIINQAVTKGLDPNTPMKDSGIPWLGEIPTHWEIKKIKYITNLTLGKMLTGEDKGGNFLKPYLRAQNISWFKCDTSDVKEMWFSQSELIKYRVNLNDLLVSEGGDVGRTCIWMNELDECYIQNSVHKITFKKYFNPKYFLYLFYCFGRKGYFLSIVNQISIGHLTGEKLKEVFTIFPGFDEQTAIVDYLDRKTDQMDDVISKTTHEIELLQEYRTTLISEAVTGKIKVS